jgi:hypothetical protein
MKRNFILSFLVSGLLIMVLSAGPASALQENAEKAAIESVVQTAYIDGIQNQGDIEDIMKGFHPGFNLLMKKGEDMNLRPIGEWIKSVEKKKQENPDGPAHKTTGKFASIDITGDAAVVKLELYRNAQQIFTDYLLLYKFNSGWKIVSKIYKRH